MFKALIKLGLLAIIPLIYLIVAENYNPLKYMDGRLQEKFMGEVYLGVFKEIEREILSVDQDSRVARFEEIAKEFRNELRIAKIEDITETSNQQSRLREGELVSLRGEGSYVAYLLTGTDWVVAAASGETDALETLRLASGPMAMLRRALSEISVNELGDSIEKLQKRFGWEMNLVSSEELAALQRDKKLYQHGDLEWFFEESSDYEIFLVAASGGKTLVVRPVFSQQLQLLSMLVPFFLFLSFICLSVMLWLWPLWKDHQKLYKTTKAFGNGRLESRVKMRKGSFSAELGESFNLMADNIQNLITTNQNLTNAIAHDLRTPLARLRFANAILDSQECSAEEAERSRNTVNSSIDALDYLINQTLMHSRYNRSTDIKRFTDCNFSLEILDEVDLCRFQEEDIEFETNIDSALLNKSQFVDSKALRRALSNLLSNAAKYAKSYVLISYFEDRGLIGFKVEDDGDGIAERDYETVFEPYTQLDNTERNKSRGLGLGLAIVKQIAHWHKGEVRVEESPLGGASFTVAWRPSELKSI